jgi:radical SAM superfamily enzyme YgiQ (UPF0313 family)
MNILLINPASKTSLVCPPLGLAYLAASLQKSNYQVTILDYSLEKFSKENLLKIIKEKNISIIGLTAVTPNIKETLFLANLIKKKFPKKIIILGGPHATLQAEKILKTTGSIDYILRGEGEIRLPKLIEYILKKECPENLAGLTFRKNNQIINTPEADFISNLDNLPFPARELLDIQKYSKHLFSVRKPATTILTSRGCPYHCIYCSKPITGSKFRARSPENVVSEIELLKNKYNIKEIIFYDDTFTLDKERVLKICQSMIEKKLGIQWKCETRVNLVDEELLKLMKKAGCYLIAYGIESGSQKILDILKKNITLSQIERSIKITKEAGIDVLGYFMLGIPGENEKDIQKTINFAKKLNIDYAQFSIATAYPETELYQIAKSQNKLPKDFSESFYALGSQKNIISLCDLAPKTLERYSKKAYHSFYLRPTYIYQRLLKINPKRDFNYLLRGLRILTKVW